MKLGILGDLHIRYSTPINRIDNDYYSTQFTKLRQAFQTFKKEKCFAVLMPGDVFNNYGRDPLIVLHDLTAFLNKYSSFFSFYAVFGQHDLRFHNLEVTDVPLRILASAGIVHILGAKATTIGDNVFLYGMNWNENIPVPSYVGSNFSNILVMHQMVVKHRKKWPQQTDYIKAKRLCNKYSYYDLFVCGDNHQAFTYENKIVNCGSLCRMNIDQIDHKPMYAVYDTETKKLKKYRYTILPNVLQEAEFIQKKENKEHTDEFAASLHSDFEAEMNYRENINKILKKKRRITTRTKKILEEALNG